jgi:hypothetical protein
VQLVHVKSDFGAVLEVLNMPSMVSGDSFHCSTIAETVEISVDRAVTLTVDLWTINEHVTRLAASKRSAAKREKKRDEKKRVALSVA